jgi:hypothetical protein
VSPRILFFFLLVAFPCLALAETAYVEATQDNTLYQSPGGLFSNGMGKFVVVGQTNELLKRRALIAFKDLEEVIPDGATVMSVKIHVFLSTETSEATPVDLKRLTSDWGEGASVEEPGETDGANAKPGDATWVNTFFNFSRWGRVGGDFLATPSDSQVIDNVGWYTFGSTEAMVTDVQNWVDNPGSNYGWIMIGDETVASERQFFSRNYIDPGLRPVLEIQYSKTGSVYDFSGAWADPALDGEGYIVLQTPAGWLIYYFGYGIDGGFLWLVSDLVTLDQLIFGTPFELEMFIGKPGTFYNPAPSSDLMSYGKLSVDFDTCTTGQFILNGLNGEKISNVSKLIGIDNTDCPFIKIQ